MSRYAQIAAGQRLHIVREAGEEYGGEVIRKGFLSQPLCWRKTDRNYRMTINMPLASLCRNCGRIARDVRIVEF